MNRIQCRKPIGGAIAVSILFIASAATIAQTAKTEVAVFQLGDQATLIPAPEGFEEAASQFAAIKKLMTATESPSNDMLAVHLPHADCEKLRAGGIAPFNFYTKISVLRDGRDQDYSAARFAELIATFRKSGSQILDVNGPTMKGAAKQLNKGLTDLSKQETQVDLGQPINLGEFDTRPNVYSVMLIMNITIQTRDGKPEARPLLGGVSFVRIKQRIIFVYTYRKYVSNADVEVLRDFTKQWIGQILAAN